MIALHYRYLNDLNRCEFTWIVWIWKLRMRHTWYRTNCSFPPAPVQLESTRSARWNSWFAKTTTWLVRALQNASHVANVSKSYLPPDPLICKQNNERNDQTAKNKITRRQIRNHKLAHLIINSSRNFVKSLFAFGCFIIIYVDLTKLINSVDP